MKPEVQKYFDYILDHPFTSDTFNYNKWLNEIKIHLSLSLDDDSRDNHLLAYLEIAHKNLWECYYRFDGEYGFYSQKGVTHQWYSDNITKMAVFHLTAVFFQNPDEILEVRNFKDDRMIMRIIGSRMSY